MAALHELDLGEASRRIASGGVSPVELTEALLARIEALEPRLQVGSALGEAALLAAAAAFQRATEWHQARPPLPAN